MFSIYLAKKHAMGDKVALGTGQGTKMDVFSKNLQGGGEGNFQSKNLCCKFQTFI